MAERCEASQELPRGRRTWLHKRNQTPSRKRGDQPYQILLGGKQSNRHGATGFGGDRSLWQKVGMGVWLKRPEERMGGGNGDHNQKQFSKKLWVMLYLPLVLWAGYPTPEKQNWASGVVHLWVSSRSKALCLTTKMNRWVDGGVSDWKITRLRR